MNSDVLLKIDEIVEIINNSNDVKRYKELKEQLLKDNDFIIDIDKVKQENAIYDNNYIALKEKILSNDKFREFKNIENILTQTLIL